MFKNATRGAGGKKQYSFTQATELILRSMINDLFCYCITHFIKL